jgi:hypothetical protein
MFRYELSSDRLFKTGHYFLGEQPFFSTGKQEWRTSMLSCDRPDTYVAFPPPVLLRQYGTVPSDT